MVIIYLIDIALVMNTIMKFEIEDMIYSGFWFNLVVMMINNLTQFYTFTFSKVVFILYGNLFKKSISTNTENHKYMLR